MKKRSSLPQLPSPVERLPEGSSAQTSETDERPGAHATHFSGLRRSVRTVGRSGSANSPRRLAALTARSKGRRSHEPALNLQAHAEPSSRSLCRLQFAPIRASSGQSRATRSPLASVRASPRRRPNGRSSLIPRRPSTRRSGYASAHINSAKATNSRSRIFHDPAAVAATNWTCFKRFAASNGHEAADRRGIRRRSALRRAYDLRASIVGFNLPFDISRLAINTALRAAKRCVADSRSSCRRIWWRPAIQVRHLNARASLIQFTHPPKRRDPRGQRKRKIAPRNRRGSFIDLKTIAAALYSRRSRSRRSPTSCKTPTRKAESGGHGKQLTAKICCATCSRTFRSPGNAIRAFATDTRFMPLKRRRSARC